MKKLFVVLVLATGACESRNDVAATQTPPPANTVDRSDPWQVSNPPGVGYEARTANTPTRSTWDTNANPMPADQDFDDARAKFSADIKARMDALDARLSQLDTEARNLRAERDELAKQVASASDQTRDSWEQFKANIREALSRLENELNARR